MTRTGEQYLRDLAARPRSIWLGNSKIRDVTDHPAFTRTAQSIASLYDQAAADTSTSVLRDPDNRCSDGSPALRAYSIPHNHADLRAKHNAHDAWARPSFGFLGRSPDYMAAGAAGWATRPEAFTSRTFDGAANATSLYQRLRENDLFAAFTITNPSTNRAMPVDAQGAGDLLMHVDRETTDGLVISGAKTIGTGAVFADEIIVGTIEPLRTEDEPYAFTLALDPTAEGVHLISRTSYESTATSAADNPLSHRFDENDALLVCREVHVPWERILTYRDTETTGRIWWGTPAYTNMAHQAAVRFAVKLEFLAGLAMVVAEENGGARNPSIRAELGRLAGYAHTAQAIALGAASAYEVDPGDHGAVRVNQAIIFAQRQFAAEAYPAALHQLRMLCGGSLTQLPVSIEDLSAPVIGELLNRYSRTAGQTAEDRIRLMKLVWDVTGSEFAIRHAHYEQFYQGAPHVYLGQLAGTSNAAAMAEYATTALHVSTHAVSTAP
ncbi:4-hydroxyphenylacetate 3-hydroxylase family protein [Rhodococcus qingshengii]|uniref:4-hydroxyphenylacetate 3-hydroxylase family protein n=1 Tax=Rhodococcus qingshengii TaxID=334542 RepID=UPI0010A67CD8|nr:4-hydroxyphenylacetate 3-hydroxylase N-terminal domain-containing protein [Rhodococcus qingshengii]THJ67653.1 4-hydroxyphenylacetate 3-monooxygenase [Rhodococcus qingshengii]